MTNNDVDSDSTGAATPASSSAESQLQHGPLHDEHVAAGATMAEFGGWLMPIQYDGGGVVAEHTAVRESVGLFDVSHLGKVQITGPGAKDFLNHCFTGDLDRAGPGKAQYTMCCYRDGGVVDDMITYIVSADEVFCMPNAANTAEVHAMLAAAAPEELTVSEQHTAYAVLAVQGPKSSEVLSQIGLPLVDEFMAYTDTEWTAPDGRSYQVRVCRSGYTGELGHELLPEWSAAGPLWQELLRVAAEHGGKPAGLGARDTLRTEIGLPLHGHELAADITPVQASASWAVGWSKPEFWGREALIAERESGPARRLRGLRALERGVPRPQMRVLDGNDEQVGITTSGTFAPTAQTGIALALLDTGAGVSLGDEVWLEVRGRRLRCEVVKPPFVQTGNS